MNLRHPLHNTYAFPTIAPSILAADYTQLGAEIESCTATGIKWIHCDVMDGHFVPNISFGPMIVEAARRSAPEAFLDTHLMIEKPALYLEAFQKAGADLITIHAEADPHAHRTLNAIKAMGLYAGVAINPGTPLTQIEELLPEVDLVCVMSVNPGFGGQAFIKASIPKIQRLAAWRRQMGLNFLIEIDGGAGVDNAEIIARAGTDIIVCGSSVFGAQDRKERIQRLTQKTIIGSTDLA
ncbi:ribulose-5-phosphate 3-epimerase [Cyclonatronum proteinivorum]|uniref:Ribulose-phosphate 3-epimerase n=1 Tax=Cyclonatronum proteinivorum TaxID=1457365 RepID=A0A345UI50_9BACT|nr:ribulose-phosphate 3-epimerase [Cyclonatronum proteinivorum]AXJ00152.1 ribulose-5-phosphate 3-epimerase [Cyclonatronum proteinivorum]